VSKIKHDLDNPSRITGIVTGEICTCLGLSFSLYKDDEM
jgi:hypothetical protein